MGLERRAAVVGTIVVLAVALSGCSLFGTGAGAAARPQPRPADPGAGAAGPVDPIELAKIGVLRQAKVGKIVVDEAGRTLYRSDRDSADPPESNCLAGCATSWPPVRAAEKMAINGLDQDLIGAIRRRDGVEQLTLAGWPLYRNPGDQRRGQIKGHGADGQWHAVTPRGTKALPLPTKPAATWSTKPTRLEAADDPELGAIVIDEVGRTLYRFDKDRARPSRSNCLRDCARIWPPLRFSQRLELRGVARAAVGSVKRPDGIRQLTLNGWPLYRYVEDVPGEAGGHGIGGGWFASTPSGAPVKARGGSGGSGGQAGAPGAPGRPSGGVPDSALGGADGSGVSRTGDGVDVRTGDRAYGGVAHSAKTPGD